eukprot:1864586-Pyramimonas_sp.AAC.1
MARSSTEEVVQARLTRQNARKATSRVCLAGWRPDEAARVDGQQVAAVLFELLPSSAIRHAAPHRLGVCHLPTVEVLKWPQVRVELRLRQLHLLKVLRRQAAAVLLNDRHEVGFPCDVHGLRELATA